MQEGNDRIADLIGMPVFSSGNDASLKRIAKNERPDLEQDDEQQSQGCRGKHRSLLLQVAAQSECRHILRWCMQ